MNSAQYSTPRRVRMVRIKEGVELPVFGNMHRLQHSGQLRGIVECRDGIVFVPGAPESLKRRTHEWLAGELRKFIEPIIAAHAQALGKSVQRISIRDTHSQWGSCTADGNLSFSWRLALMPYAVIEYIVCHEVAHLVQMNHRPAFWRVVSDICPEWRTAYRWLKINGPEMLKYR